jgi:hypothetical protein
MLRFSARAGDRSDRSVRTGSAAARSDGSSPKQRPCKLLDIPAERMETANQDNASAAQEQEWLRQLSLIYSGLIVIGVYLVAPLLTAASLDLSAKDCVVAFSLAISLLAALVIVNRQEVLRRCATTSVLATIARVVAQTTPSLAWSPASGTLPGSLEWGMLAGGLVGVAVHSAGYARLERDQAIGTLVDGSADRLCVGAAGEGEVQSQRRHVVGFEIEPLIQ